jgi:DNA-binding winged helix-turn-helix (wHTH) protein
MQKISPSQRNGEAVTLTPRAFDVLLLLLTHAGHVVEKRQMFDEVWKESFVTDNALTKIIKELRHALGDSADEPSYIETVPKRGYRFIGKLEDVPDVDETECRTYPLSLRRRRLREVTLFSPPPVCCS